MSADKPEIPWRETPEALAFHDLKNHLGVALINTALLRRRVDGADARSQHHLELIQQSLDAVSALAEQLREFVRLAVAPQPLQRKALALDALLEEALEGCRTAADGKLPRLEPSPPRGVAVLGEQPTTSRMITNLLAAALQEAAQVPGVTLGVTAVDGGLRFDVAVAALAGEEPATRRHALLLALATAQAQVAAHGGTWQAPELGSPLRLGFTLPRG